MKINQKYQQEELKNILVEEGQTKDNIASIVSSFKRIVETPLGAELNFGYYRKSKKSDEDELARTPCLVSDPLTILYGLFKFAEKCGDYKEFSLSSLMDEDVERDGVSPTQIFGIARERMKSLLLGLSATHSDFISASFTHDLEKISLAKDKTSQDVLDLFR